MITKLQAFPSYSTLRNSRLKSKKILMQRKSIQVFASVQPSEIKNKSSSSIITIEGNDRVQVGVRRSGMTGNALEADLSSYLVECPTFLPELTLPLGAKIVPTPDLPGYFDLTVPKMEFYDICIQPKATTQYSARPGAVSFFSNTAELVGAPDALGLDGRYELQVEVEVEGRNTPGELEAKVQVEVWVDLPAPFSLIPAVVIQPIASAVLTSMTSLLLKEFLNSLAMDFDRWIQDPQERAARKQQGSLV